MSEKVLITGGNGGIAQALKQLLEAEDYEVWAPSRSEMDVTNWQSIEAAMQQFTPDILVNNAGYVVPQSVREMDLENTQKHFSINVGGTFYCTGIALRYNPNLQIVNIGSAAAIEPHATWSEYCASKAAVVMATQCWAADGLYAVVISPGRTRTKMRKSLFPLEDQSTLLEPLDFAKVVMKAIHKDYPSGTHIIVRKQNVQQLLSQ
ncbi:MAG: SDR family oxidoreductase [Bacteroidales bacterium]|nr:SDR family oxidoreductase [Bacteroidales bacterium]MBQ3983016.1 SDR family oxidoreductase [Bacteroidales bacterium]